MSNEEYGISIIELMQREIQTIESLTAQLESWQRARGDWITERDQLTADVALLEAKLARYEGGVETRAMLATDIISGGQALYLGNCLNYPAEGDWVKVLVMKEALRWTADGAENKW